MAPALLAIATAPFVISGAVTGAAATAGVGLAGQAAISAIVPALVKIGFATGLSLAASAIFRPDVPKPSGRQLEFKQVAPPRSISYGRVRKAGPLAFWRTAKEGQKNALFKIVLLNSREIDAIETHFLNGEEVTTGDNDWVEESQDRHDSIPRARIVQHAGTEDQVADDLLLDNFGDWTADHRLRGIAYVVCEFVAAGEKFSKVYPSGEPDYQALIRGNKLYDPRLDTTAGGSGSHRVDDMATWEWSDNAALAAQDYLLWPKKRGGFGFAANRLYWPDWISKANLCDELVALKAGGTEKRYRVAATIELAPTERWANLRTLLEAFDGRLIRRSDGLIGIKGGVWEAPDVILDGGAGEIIDGQIANGIASPDLYNELSFRYLSPDHKYIEQDGDAWQDASIEIPGGGIKRQSIELGQVPSHGQARRLAKLIMARDNAAFIGDVTTNFAGLDALGAEVVDLRLPELDTDTEEVSGPFWIDGGVKVAGDVSGTSFAVRKARPDAYNWDAVLEEGTAPPVIPDPDDPPDIFPPQDFAVTVEDRTIGTPPVIVDAAVLTWDAVDSDEDVEVEALKVVSGATWQPVSVAPGAETAEYLPLEAGISYEFRARTLAAGDATSTWVTAFVIADPDVVAAIAAMTVPPLPERQHLYQDLILGLKSDGIWTLLDAISVIAAHDAQAGRLNLRNPAAFNLTVGGGAPVFTVDRGYLTDGVDDWLDTGFNPTTATTPHFVQNSASFGIWNRTVAAVNAGAAGWFDGTNGTTIGPQLSSGAASFRINQAASSSAAGVGGAALFVANRSGASATELYKNGAEVTVGTAPDQASTAPVNASFRLGNANAGVFANREFAALVIGASLDSTRQAALYARLNTFLTAVGAA